MYTAYNAEEKKKQSQSGTAAAQNTGFTYDPFKVSAQTQLADQKRQNLQAQKPADFTYQAYQPSSKVQQAQALLQQQLVAKPGSYQSQWQGSIDDTLQQMWNRDKFTYDLNADALYQQYANQYMLQGQQAMMDTMGQAAALTGGYGNSYAQNAGQQAYQSYLQQLNDRVPELYQLALDQYTREGEALQERYALYADRESQDYARYQDSLNAYYSELDRLAEDARYREESEYNRYMDQYNMAYGQHRDAVSDWQQQLALANEEYWNQYNRDYGQYTDDRNFSYTDYMNALEQAYQQQRDQVADQRYQQELEYQQEQDRIAQEQWQQQYDESVRQWQAEYDEDLRRYEQERADAIAAVSYSGGSSGSGDESDEYYEPSQKDIDGIDAHITELAADSNATLSDLETYLDGLVETRNYDPSYVAKLFEYYSGKFKTEIPKPAFTGVTANETKGTGTQKKWKPIAMQ